MDAVYPPESSKERLYGAKPVDTLESEEKAGGKALIFIDLVRYFFLLFLFHYFWTEREKKLCPPADMVG